MKELKLFFILTAIFCLIVSLVGCNKVETEKNDNEIITETIATTARIQEMSYINGSDRFKVKWTCYLKAENSSYNHSDYSNFNYSYKNIDLNTYEITDSVPITSYINNKQYKKYKEIFDNKEEVEVTLIINYSCSKNGYEEVVSRKVIPNF